MKRAFTRRLEGFSDSESDALLEFLFGHLEATEFTLHYRWSVGDAVLWNNRCTQHSAMNDYHGYRRVAHRATIANEAADWAKVWGDKEAAA